jgi:hypothetical protein
MGLIRTVAYQRQSDLRERLLLDSPTGSNGWTADDYRDDPPSGVESLRLSTGKGRAMGRKSSDPNQDVIAKGCLRALELANDPARLAMAPCEQLGVAAAFLARARARFVDGGPAVGFRGADALQKLDAAGRAIGEELRRRTG